jgi:hypothetical protein
MREQSVETTTRKALRPVIAPFLRPFEGWNKRAAHISATLGSRLTSSDDRDMQRELLAELRAEVLEANRSFKEAVGDYPTNDRIDDVQQAHSRLLQWMDRIAS